ncbi:MAG: hypothetical protein WC804_18950 [Sphingomonas sp.]|uniref:hypothetical protein n=1 Tax=Sphingomonas sp. TaxID=28214 RepID=UPI003561FF22
MATTPPPEAPPTPEQVPPEFTPPSPDVDVPSPAAPAPSTDSRSDIQQVVEARRDAVERGEGGREPEILASAALPPAAPVAKRAIRAKTRSSEAVRPSAISPPGYAARRSP